MAGNAEVTPKARENPLKAGAVASGALRIYGFLSLFPLLSLVLLLAAQVAFTFDARSLWYSDEVRYANAFQNMVEGGHWIVLRLNDDFYPDKPPGYFWFLALLRHIPGLKLIGAGGLPGLFFFASAVSGLFCLLAAYAMARLVAGLDRRGSLAAGIILLSGFYFSGLLHYLRMDVLFAASITLAQVLLFRALVRERAYGLMAAGFIAAGAAALIKGPLGLAFPLLSAVLFLGWQGRFRRLFRLDFLIGGLLGLAIPVAWLFMAWDSAGRIFIDDILNRQIAARALDAWHHREPWYYYFLAFPLIWLPWTFLLFLPPWGEFFKKENLMALWRSRAGADAGQAYIWTAFLGGFALLSIVSTKIAVYGLPLFPPLAVLSAKSLLNLSAGASKTLQKALGVMFLALSAILFIVPLLPAELFQTPVTPQGLHIAGGVALAAACAVAFLPDLRSEGLLLVMALFTIVFSYPVWSISAPSLDAFMSPRAQAEKLGRFREAGYYPGTYKVYDGTYSFYCGGAVHQLRQWSEVEQAIAEQPKIVLALRASFWDGLEEKPAGFEEIDRQRIVERHYVLVARPVTPEKGPVNAQSPAGPH